MHAAAGRLRLVAAGCGQVFERFHLPAILRTPEVALVGVCDPSSARRAWLLERLPHLPVAATLEELLVAAPADALLVLTPPTTHRDLALRGLAAGLHLLIEKPMALSSADAAAMVDAAARAGRCLQVGFTRRFREPYQQLQRELQHEGGMVQSVRAELAVPAAQWAAHGEFSGRDALGGGVLDDVLSHEVDLLAWLLGAWPTAVRVCGGAAASHRVACELVFPSGLVVSCVAAHARYVERVEVAVGKDRVLLASGTRFRRGGPGSAASRWRRGPLDDQLALIAGRVLRRPGVTQESFVRQLRDFARVVRGEGNAGGADGPAGVRTVATIEACRRAAASSRWEPVAG
ncbi:MAG TPA: Gfo/Idh/MocA family oxidoreductase [Gemmatimonadales bacterium]|nr:Gfo/Idh/MocA family oxidoreductase [Gemmatimonadales bacterium]